MNRPDLDALEREHPADGPDTRADGETVRELVAYARDLEGERDLALADYQDLGREWHADMSRVEAERDRALADLEKASRACTELSERETKLKARVAELERLLDEATKPQPRAAKRGDTDR
jgi:chromosome segregation ATPase